MPDPISWEFAGPYLALAFIGGYLLGAVPFGLVLTRLAGLGDLRQVGSGNIGTTNVLRTGRKDLAALTLELAHKGTMSLLDALARLTLAPARILGLEAGRLKAGAPADLGVFDAERPWRIDPDGFRSKSKNSPFENHPVQGKVLRSVVDGRAIFEAEA